MNTKTTNVLATVDDTTSSTAIALQLEDMTEKWRMSLPSQIPVDRFKRVVITAIQQNPDLVHADRKSLWMSCTKAANDGLLPDGREGALVVFKTKMKFKTPQGGSVEKFVEAVQWMPMIAGLRKKVRNSGEIADWNARVVYQKDKFEYRLGDDEMILHAPYMGADDPGEVVAAYSIAKLKGGEISREVMTRRQIDKVRAVSRSANGPAWSGWFDEMARKSVAKRHAKVLPMNTDLDDLVRRVTSDVEASEEQLATSAKRPQLADFTSMPGGSTAQPAETTQDSDQQEGGQQDSQEQKDDAGKAETQQEDKPAHDPETGELKEEQPQEERKRATIGDPDFGAADAYAMGVERRDANKPMSTPPDLAKDFHEAFLSGWRARDDELSAKAKAAKAAKGKT